MIIDLQQEHERLKMKFQKKFKSDWGSTPQEVIAGIMMTLEREVEWPLSDVLYGDKLINAKFCLQAIRELLNEELK